MNNQFKTKILDSDSISTLMSLQTCYLSKKILELNDKKFAIAYNNRVVELDIIDSIRIINELAAKKLLSTFYKNIIISNFSKCNTSIGLGMPLISSMPILSEKEISLNVRKLVSLSERVNSQDVFCFMKALCQHDYFSFEISKEAIKKSGGIADIIISESVDSMSKISIEHGYKFNINIEDIYSDNVFSTMRKLLYNSARIIIVDGIVESVSQINGILNDAYESKQSVIFVCRGFLPEVLNTMAVNQIKKLLNVCPVTISFDDYGYHQLHDIAKATNSTVYCVDKGDQITSINLFDNQLIDNVKITNRSLYFNDAKLSKNRDNIIREILTSDDINKNTERAIKEKRIKSLLPNLVTLEIGKHSKDLTGTRNDRVHELIKLYRVSALRGMVKVDHLKNMGISFRNLHTELEARGIEKIPLQIITTILRGINSTNTLLKNVGAGILID